MSEFSLFSFGEHILLRGVMSQIIWWAMPVTVVRDTPDLIAFYWRAGTPNKTPQTRLSPKEIMTLEKLNLIDSTWTETDVLMLVTPGAAHAVYAMWESGHTSFRCWYVDLQDPLRRTALGFDTMDHLLDIVISADQSVWRWKDEDELKEAIEIGLFTPEQALAMRAEGERVIKTLHEKQSLFSSGWEKWSPPPKWQIPVFPVNWDDIKQSNELL